MYYVYVLKNSANRHYIGITDDLEKRLNKHNTGSVRSTKAYGPWKLVYNGEFTDKTGARKREIFLKKTAAARIEIFKKIEALSSSG